MKLLLENITMLCGCCSSSSSSSKSSAYKPSVFTAGQMFMPETKHIVLDKPNKSGERSVVPCSLWEACIHVLPSGGQARKRRGKIMTSQDKLAVMDWRSWKGWRGRSVTPFLEWWWILSVAQTWFWPSFSSSEETNTHLHISLLVFASKLPI